MKGVQNRSCRMGKSIVGRIIGVWFPQQCADTWVRLWIFLYRALSSQDVAVQGNIADIHFLLLAVKEPPGTTPGAANHARRSLATVGGRHAETLARP